MRYSYDVDLSRETAEQLQRAARVPGPSPLCLPPGKPT